MLACVYALAAMRTSGTDNTQYLQKQDITQDWRMS